MIGWRDPIDHHDQLAKSWRGAHEGARISLVVNERNDRGWTHYKIRST
jgi:hypothetical protein